MASPRKTQKQIAQRYAGNLKYYRVLHSLRRTKILLTGFCLLLAVAVMSIFLIYGRTTPRMEWINSPGPVSQPHAQIAQDCKACHGLKMELGPLGVKNTIDSSCQHCHTNHVFHQPNVVVNHTCTSCHQEHLGTGPMKATTDVNCMVCHGNQKIMEASARKAATMAPSDFDQFKDEGLVLFHPPHPRSGYTETFKSFADGHPEFQIKRNQLQDPNTLKFNHAVHLTGDIPKVNGKKLDCTYCHQPDSQGAYLQPVNFSKSCQACHALQIDPTLPGFQIPHPEGSTDPSVVRNFLLTLPTQYAAYASLQLGITEDDKVQAFVGQHMKVIRDRVREGDDLIKSVYFADARHVSRTGTGTTTRDRALFPGCVYCHEVQVDASHEPIVTKPFTPDRWFVHAKFDHASHDTVTCQTCHDSVTSSTKTSDVLIPDKATCVTCHSPKGGVISTCSTCHVYHNDEAEAHVPTAQPSLREMMLKRK